MDKRKEKIKAFFAHRPSVKRAYMTSDSVIFLMKKTAQSHAKSLDVKKIEKLIR